MNFTQVQKKLCIYWCAESCVLREGMVISFVPVRFLYKQKTRICSLGTPGCSLQIKCVPECPPWSGGTCWLRVQEAGPAVGTSLTQLCPVTLPGVPHPTGGCPCWIGGVRPLKAGWLPPEPPVRSCQNVCNVTEGLMVIMVSPTRLKRVILILKRRQ